MPRGIGGQFCNADHNDTINLCKYFSSTLPTPQKTVTRVDTPVPLLLPPVSLPCMPHILGMSQRFLQALLLQPFACKTKCIGNYVAELQMEYTDHCSIDFNGGSIVLSKHIGFRRRQLHRHQKIIQAHFFYIMME